MKGRQVAKKPLTLVVRPAPLNRSRALLQLGHLTFPAAIGRSGRTVLKREGDGGTPVAVMRILDGYRRRDRVRVAPAGLALKASRPGDVWCDASGHPLYNRPARAPLAASHEEMQRTDTLYDICLVLDWNITQRARQRGSAIFFHLNHPGYTPTAGCVAISLRHMLRLLPLLKRGTRLKVVK